MAKLTHADYLASELKRLGIERVFCLMGDTNLDFIGALLRQKIRLIHGRHEQGVVAMADGYARFSNKFIPAVCTVTQSAGLTNTTTSLFTALNAGSSVLLITGDNPENTGEQRFDQAAFCRIVSHNAATITIPSSMHKDVQSIFTNLANSNGVGIINMSTQLWKEPIVSSKQLIYKKKSSSASTASLQKALDLLKNIDRPVILAGRGAAYSNAEVSVTDLAEKLGAPIVTTVPALGFANNHFLHAGTAGTIGIGTGSQALEKADCIVAIGTRMSHWTLDEGIVTYKKPIIRIEQDKKAQNQQENHLMLWGDANAVAATLSEQLPPASRIPWFNAQPITEPEHTPGDTLNPFVVLSRLNDLLPEKRTIVVDAGQNTIFAMRAIHISHNCDFAWTSDFSAIGQGLGVAIGAAFARPKERITLIVGDGGFMMSIAELDTVARYNLSITIIVINDQGFGQERGALINRSIPETEANYRSPDLAALAHAYGIAGIKIATDSDMESLASRLETISEPLVVDIRSDPTIRTDFGKRVAEHRKVAQQLKN